jgi:transposase
MFFPVLRPSQDRFKALLWQGDGFLLLYKRFEKGRLQWPRTPDEVD